MGPRQIPLFVEQNCTFEGAYVVHLRRLLHGLPKERVRIYWTDDFLANPTVVVDPSTEDFDLKHVTGTKYNTIPKSHKADPDLDFSPELRNEMEEATRSFNQQLMAFLGEIPPWLDDDGNLSGMT